MKRETHWKKSNKESRSEYCHGFVASHLIHFRPVRSLNGISSEKLEAQQRRFPEADDTPDRRHKLMEEIFQEDAAAGGGDCNNSKTEDDVDPSRSDLYLIRPDTVASICQWHMHLILIVKTMVPQLVERAKNE
ncbi:hypothetical protein OPV22_005649 [Ensete ventricosum]|uniref:Uncharacterized protein n=1 Tax=Ensete ventricosum TaxID=4639 RepID=A0AAV8RRI0_ENSVE|nr:hypothetical protein OPV22_005649 [Ensete ventricosum]